MFRSVTVRLVFIQFYLEILCFDSKVNAITWPECGEFAHPSDDINLSTEEEQFRRKLPILFDSFDGNSTTSIENTVKTVETFDVPFASSERKTLAKQTLSPTLDVVSMKYGEKKTVSIVVITIKNEFFRSKLQRFFFVTVVERSNRE